jgi:chromate transporter
VPLALVATAGIFLPSFFMVAALAPLVGRIRRSAWLGPALDGVTVAALGLMAGVTIDLARAAITDALTAGIAAVGLAVLLWKQPSPVWLIGAGAAIGIAHAML